MMIAGLLGTVDPPSRGWVEVSGEHIRATGAGDAPRPPDVDHDGPIAPGLCDLQVNGAAGVEVTEGEQALRRIDEALLARGVTSYLPTVISTDPAVAARAVGEIAAHAADPRSPVEGVHLEGPFVSPEHAGVHRREWLRAPAGGLPGYYGDACVRMVTLAPELPGALALVEALAARGVLVSLGHSGASAAVATAAVEAGARSVTHLFNAMAALDRRAPGLAGVALDDERLSPCVIADGVHVDPLVLRLVRRAAGERVVLVTDSSPATDAPPGRYRLAGVEIERTADGRSATLDGAPAGSALTLDGLVAAWRRWTGTRPAEALAAASSRPASLIGLDTGLHAGARAELVLLDRSGAAARVMRRGRWVA
jgi:N-acetylglucosamine-6-phosphate deacetylase